MNQRPFSPSPRHRSGLASARLRQLSKHRQSRALTESEQTEFENLEFRRHLRSIERAPAQARTQP